MRVEFIGSDDELAQVAFRRFDPLWISGKAAFQPVTHNLWLIISRRTTSPGILSDRGSLRNGLVDLSALVEVFCGGFGVFLAVEGQQTQFVPLLFGCLTFLFVVFGQGMQFQIISSLGENH